jgi:hypothetical protein
VVVALARDSRAQCKEGTTMYTWVIAVVLVGGGLLGQADRASADEVYYKWRDSTGQWHYSNAANPSAVKMLDLSGMESPVREPEARAHKRSTGASKAIERYKLRRETRHVRREIRQIDGFFADVRALQRERFDSYSVRDILEDWQVADRALEMRGRRRTLSRELSRLEDEERSLSGAGSQAARLAPVRAVAAR